MGPMSYRSLVVVFSDPSAQDRCPSILGLQIEQVIRKRCWKSSHSKWQGFRSRWRELWPYLTSWTRKRCQALGSSSHRHPVRPHRRAWWRPGWIARLPTVTTLVRLLSSCCWPLRQMPIRSPWSAWKCATGQPWWAGEEEGLWSEVASCPALEERVPAVGPEVSRVGRPWWCLGRGGAREWQCWSWWSQLRWRWTCLRWYLD